MLGKVSIAVKNFGVCDFSRLAVTHWRLRRWRLWFLALMTATQTNIDFFSSLIVCLAKGDGARWSRAESRFLAFAHHLPRPTPTRYGMG